VSAGPLPPNSLGMVERMVASALLGVVGVCLLLGFAILG
jgi:hypothetical protein